MKFVNDKVVSRGAYELANTLLSVDKMFQSVVDGFDRGPRDCQKRWLIVVVNDIRTKKIM